MQNYEGARPQTVGNLYQVGQLAQAFFLGSYILGLGLVGVRIRVRVSIGGRVRVRFWLGPGTRLDPEFPL